MNWKDIYNKDKLNEVATAGDGAVPAVRIAFSMTAFGIFLGE